MNWLYFGLYRKLNRGLELVSGAHLHLKLKFIAQLDCNK